jgi:hypothetical protein
MQSNHSIIPWVIVSEYLPRIGNQIDISSLLIAFKVKQCKAGQLHAKSMYFNLNGSTKQNRERKL